MNFKQYDDGKEGRFFVILDNGVEAGWIQYKWLGNGNLLANGTRVYEEFKDQKLGIPLFNKLVEFAEKRKTKIYPLCPFVVNQCIWVNAFLPTTNVSYRSFAIGMRIFV